MFTIFQELFLTMATLYFAWMALAVLRLLSMDMAPSDSSCSRIHFPPGFTMPAAALLHHVPLPGLSPCSFGCIPRRRFPVYILLLMAGIERNPGPPRIHFGLLNVRSAINKSALIHDMVVSNNLDFTFFTETWFKTTDPPAITENIAPDGFLTIHSFRDGRRKGRGGGLSVIFKRSLNFQRLSLPFKPTSFEYLLVYLLNKNVRTNFIAIYRPPPLPNSVFFDELNMLADSLDQVPGEFCLLGDFNCPGQTPGQLDSRLVDFLEDRDLVQSVNKPTRSENTLDLIIFSRPLANATLSPTQVFDIPFSDHRLVTHQSTFPVTPPQLITYAHRNLKNLDLGRFQAELRETTSFRQMPVDPDAYAAMIDADVTSVLDHLAPRRTVTKRKSLNNTIRWHSPQSRADKRDCRRLERRYRRTGNMVDYKAWRKAGRVMAKSFASAQKDYYSSTIDNLSVDAKSKWCSIRKLLHTAKMSILHSNLTANVFNQFFTDKLSSIGIDIAARIANLSAPSVPQPVVPPASLSQFSPVSLAQADTLLLSLTKSSPVDIVPVSLLKSCHSTFAVLLSRLANVSFNCGKFPDLYKVSQITPLLKKPSLDPSVPSSFRPISNLRTLAKLLERLAQAQLRPHLCSAPAFSSYQSAYRPLYSTETATVFIADSLLRSASPTLLVSLDLSSAFDCVSHSILINRLANDFGLSGTPLAWLCSYLTSRFQYVAWNGVNSSSMPLVTGVPQGSVLGPLLFSVYISPVSRLLDSLGLKHHVYADDTTLLLSADPNLSLISRLASSSCALSNWFLFNNLQLNPSKSEVTLVGSRDKLRELCPFLASGLSLAGSPISLSPSTTILGVTFDSSLNFDSHVSEICRTVNYHLNALAHIRRFLSIPTANLIASSIIASRLDYCNSILTGLSSHNLNRLQTTQNRAARIVLGLNRMTPAEPLLRQLHWLPIHKRINYKIALLTFKTLLLQQPSYLSPLLVPYNPSRSLRSTNSNFLCKPRVCTAFQSRAFSVAAPHFWNSLPLSLRLLAVFPPPSLGSSASVSPQQLPNLDLFKRSLKTYLFDSPPFSVT